MLWKLARRGIPVQIEVNLSALQLVLVVFLKNSVIPPSYEQWWTVVTAYSGVGVSGTSLTNY